MSGMIEIKRSDGTVLYTAEDAVEDRHVCAAIQYGQVHSDLCGDPASVEWRQLLHDCLDELLDKLAPNDAHALFYVGNPTSA